MTTAKKPFCEFCNDGNQEAAAKSRSYRFHSTIDESNYRWRCCACHTTFVCKREKPAEKPSFIEMMVQLRREVNELTSHVSMLHGLATDLASLYMSLVDELPDTDGRKAELRDAIEDYRLSLLKVEYAIPVDTSIYKKRKAEILDE